MITETLADYIRNKQRKSGLSTKEFSRKLTSRVKISEWSLIKIFMGKYYSLRIREVYAAAHYLGFRSKGIHFRVLEALRKRPELTNEALSEKLGIPAYKLGRVLSGRDSTSGIQERLVKLLGVKAEVQEPLPVQDKTAYYHTLALKLGCSHHQVRRALNGYPGINPQLARRIREAASREEAPERSPLSPQKPAVSRTHPISRFYLDAAGIRVL